MAFYFGEVLLVPIVFAERTGTKGRPVLVLHDTAYADLLVVPITSHAPRRSEDIALKDWAVAGLRLPSTVRMVKLATVSKTVIERRMGQLSERDLALTREALRQFFRKII